MTGSMAAILAVAAIFALFGARNLARYVHRLRAADPLVWESVIRAYESRERREPPPDRPIVFTGSSTIFYWNTLEQDMAPLPVLGRGFGGSQIHQVTYFAERIILRYNPRAVVLYAGENDIAGALLSPKKSAAEVAASFESFCSALHSRLPRLPIYFISIKPPLKRAAFTAVVQEANRLIRERCAQDDRLAYIDIGPALLAPDGTVRRELFRRDGVHLNGRGYAVLADVVRSALATD